MTEAQWFLRKSRHTYSRNFKVDELAGQTVENDIPMHLCSHPGCTAWGCYLIGANWRRDIKGTAYCHEHLPEEHRPKHDDL